MQLNNYIRQTYGPLRYVKHSTGVSFMISSHDEIERHDWDRAIARAWDEGYELLPENMDPDIVGIWEIYNLTVRPPEVVT